MCGEKVKKVVSMRTDRMVKSDQMRLTRVGRIQTPCDSMAVIPGGRCVGLHGTVVQTDTSSVPTIEVVGMTELTEGSGQADEVGVDLGEPPHDHRWRTIAAVGQQSYAYRCGECGVCWAM
jgi:hypothetical protein